MDQIDPRIKKLSHSSRELLHKCPRKFQLYRLGSAGAEESEDDKGTFGFGTVVGDGIQALLSGKDLQQVIWNTFLGWKQDLFYVDEKRKKSFWFAVLALQKFAALRQAGYLADYEVVSYQVPETGETKLACELGFRVHLPRDFKYRGYVDLVLRNKKTGEVLVLELKTRSSAVVAQAYKNSGQAIGYSVILDTIFPGLSSYKVLYLVYKTKEQEFESVDYTKSFYQRALWLNELLIECESIELYEKHGVYPMHGGDTCFEYFKPCKYFDICTMKTSTLTKPYSAEQDQEEKYDFEIPFEKLLHTQLGEAPEFSGHVDTPEDQIL